MLLSGRELSPREREILHLIVRAYIDTGEPVGSRTISRMRHLSLSPATIRNVMADLADDGYLAQPHTSAGRIPTDKAFRDFAGTVSGQPLPAADRERIFNQMQSGESLEERVAIASRVLTEMTRNVGIAAALPRSSQELEHLELIALSDRRVLMIVATRDRMVRNRVVTLDRQFSQDELIQLRNYVNANFAGWTLESARAELLRRIEEERAMYDAVLQQLTLLYQKGLLPADPGSAARNGRRVVSGGAGSPSDARAYAGSFPRARREKARSGAARPVSRKLAGADWHSCRSRRRASRDARSDSDRSDGRSALWRAHAYRGARAHAHALREGDLRRAADRPDFRNAL